MPDTLEDKLSSFPNNDAARARTLSSCAPGLWSVRFVGWIPANAGLPSIACEADSLSSFFAAAEARAMHLSSIWLAWVACMLLLSSNWDGWLLVMMLPGSKLDAVSFNSAVQTCTCTTGCMVSAAAACASAQSLSLSDGAAWGLMSVSTSMPPLATLATGKLDTASFNSVAGCMESAARSPAAACASTWGASWGPVAVSASTVTPPLATFPNGKLAAVQFVLTLQTFTWTVAGCMVSAAWSPAPGCASFRCCPPSAGASWGLEAVSVMPPLST